LICAIFAGVFRERMERATGAWFEEISLLASAPDKQLATPIRGIAIRRIANTWHAPRSPHRLHEGEDIFARRGTPVYSATRGIVTRIGEKGLGGNAVSILGAGGRVYYYAHLDRFAPGLRAGNEVTPDTLIGFVGNTGNARTTPPPPALRRVYDRGRNRPAAAPFLSPDKHRCARRRDGQMVDAIGEPKPLG
jgi:hypothetical protein